MATINQLTKQVETANKRIADFTRKVEMYKARTERACAKANVSVNDIITDVLDKGKYQYYYYHLPKEIANRIGFDASFRICNNYEYMKENEKAIIDEQDAIERMQQEISELTKAEKAMANEYNSSLANALENAMLDFKKEWFAEMMNWYKEHHIYVNEHKEDAKKAYNRGTILLRYFDKIKSHRRLTANLSNFCKRQSFICYDEATRCPLNEYLEICKIRLNNTWERGMNRLYNKCKSFGIDEANMKVASPEITSKGFEVFITDGKPRRIYARVIWCAENSVLVEPHTRYIVTEKGMK